MSISFIGNSLIIIGRKYTTLWLFISMMLLTKLTLHVPDHDSGLLCLWAQVLENRYKSFITNKASITRANPVSDNNWF